MSRKRPQAFGMIDVARSAAAALELEKRDGCRAAGHHDESTAGAAGEPDPPGGEVELLRIFAS